MRPVRVVTTLPGSPFTGYIQGDTVYQTSDNKLYRFNGTAFTASVPTGDLTGTLDIASFAAGMRPPRVVAALPVHPYNNYDNGNLIYLTTDQKLYRLKDKTQTVATVAWTKEVDAADISVNKITAGQIEVGAIGADQIAANAITAQKLAIGSNINQIPSDAASFEHLRLGSISTSPISWSVNATGGVTYEISNTRAYDGLKSVKIVTGTNIDAYFHISAAATYPITGLLAGEKYIFSYYVYVEGAVNATVELYVRWGNGSYTGSAVPVVTPGVWQRRYQLYTVPAGVTACTLRCDINGAGLTAYFDALQFEKVAEVGAVNWPTEPSPFRVPSLTSIDGGVIKAATIVAGSLAANSVVANNISAGVINAGHLGVDSVTANAIKSNEIEGTHIKSDTITAEKLDVASLSALVGSFGQITAGAPAGQTYSTEELALATTRTYISGGVIIMEKALTAKFLPETVLWQVETWEEMGRWEITGELSGGKSEVTVINSIDSSFNSTSYVNVGFGTYWTIKVKK
jgi:hypothetical protein